MDVWFWQFLAWVLIAVITVFRVALVVAIVAIIVMVVHTLWGHRHTPAAGKT
jgi:hypothetical protein